MGFISDLSQNAIKAFSRFPVTLAWAVIGSFFLLSIYGIDDYKIIDQYNNHTLVLILGVSWLIAIQFISEALEHKLLYRFLLKACVLGGLIGFFFYLKQPDVEGTILGGGKWALLLLAGHVFVVFAPFLEIWNKHKFWNFLKEINIALLRSSIYMLVLFLGLVLAVAALELLFDVDLNDYIYLQIFIFCLGIVNTFIFLSDFPLAKKLDNSIEFNKAIEVLVKYILIPLSLLYLVIVYVYALKILFTWELPRGWVTYLISALSLLAFIIHIAIEPVRQDHKAVLIKTFFPWYFYAILPLIPLLFIALYKRIADYNFTELRYLGIVLAIWIAGMLVYMLVSKKKSLSLYAKSLFLLILLSSFGPLSAFKISINAQLSELGELVDNLKNKKKLLFSSEDYERFQSIIRYLDNRNALDQTEAYFGFNPKVAFSETGSYNMPLKIVDSLKVKIEKRTDGNDTFKIKRYKQNTSKNNFAEEITDYTHFTELVLDKTLNEQKAIQLYANNLNEVSIRYYGEVLVETNMTYHLETMAKKYDYLSKATQDEFTFRFKNKKGDFLIIFDELTYEYLPDLVNINSGKAKVFYRTYEALELP
jgi:hypothetical protein